MPEINYNLSTGINQDTLFNVRLDTKERMKDLYENFYVPEYKPPKFFIPKDISSDVLIKGDSAELPTLWEAFTSKDPEIASAAKAAIDYKAANSPRANGLGYTPKLRYQEGQEKFTTNHWWKEDHQTMYGFNPYKSIAENEDYIHHQTWDNYSAIGKVWRGVGTFAGRTLSKLVTGLVGTAGDLGAIAWNGLQEIGDLININDGTKNNFWDDVSNNALARYMEQADEYIKESVLPTYKTLDYDDKGAWSKLLDPYTWQTSFAEGAGFLLQFAVPGGIFGKMGQAGKLARTIGTLTEAELATAEGAELLTKAAKSGMTLEKAKNVSKVTNFMGRELSGTAGNISEFLTGSKNVGGISAHVFNTSMEAVSETKSGFNETVKGLMDKGMSREEAVKKASENAPTQFWLNIGILTASNAFENKLLQKALGNRSIKNLEKLDDLTLPIQQKPTTKLGQFFKETSLGKRIDYYGKNAVKAQLFEGWWEENAQTAAQRYAAGEYQRNGDDGHFTEKAQKSFIGQLLKQTKDAIKGNDKEAADSIMAGAVIGVLGGTVFSKISGERKEQEKTKADLVANYTNTRDAWLSLSTLSADIYNADGTINKEKAKEKADEINEKLEKMQSVFKRTITADQLINPQEREILQHKVFADYVKAHIMNGTEKQLVERLRDWKSKDPNELSLYGVSEELKEDASNWASTAEKLVEKWNEIKDFKYAASKNETVENYFAKSQAVKSLVFDYTALKEMSLNLSEKYKDLKVNASPFSKFPTEQAYNELHSQISALEAVLKSEDSKIDKDRIQSKIDDLKKQLEEEKNNLKTLGESKEDKTSGFMFPKKVNPKKEFNDEEKINDFLLYNWYQVNHEDAAEAHDKLIKEYSNLETGLQKYNDAVDYWDKVFNEKKKAEKEEKEYSEKELSLDKELSDLEEELEKTEDSAEKKIIEDKITDKKQEIQDLKESYNKEEEPVEEDPKEEEPVEEDLDEINETLKQILSEQTIVRDSKTSSDLAIDTPFKTTNKETRNIYVNGDPLYWKENVLEYSYDHYLSEFIKFYKKEILTNPNKYEAFIIKDTDEFLKQRLSEKQYEKFIEDGEELGAILVFREKGSKEWVKLEDKKNTPIVAFSYNQFAFSDKYEERIKGKMKKTGWTEKEVKKFYAEQQKIADIIRESVLADEKLQVPVKVTVGSLGVFPRTYSSNAFERFEGFHNREVKIVKDPNEFSGEFDAGQLLLEIPKNKTATELPFYIPVYPGLLTSSDQATNTLVYQSVQALWYEKFDTKEEAKLIVSNFLKKIFYTTENQFFKIVKKEGKYKISYFKIDENGKETEFDKFNENLKLRLNVVESIYDGTKPFIIYKRNEKTNKFSAVEISTKDYRDFIHSNLVTNRKLLIVTKGKNKTEKVWTQRVNGYFNIEAIDSYDVSNEIAETTTEEIITPTIIQNIENSDIEAKKADIERRKQEELEQVDDEISKIKNSKTKEDLIAAIKKYSGDDISKTSGLEIRSALLTPGGISKAIELYLEENKHIEELKKKSITDKYNAELAALEEQPKIILKDLSFDDEGKVEPTYETIPNDIEKLIERKKKELEDAKKALEVALDKAPTDAIKKILTKKGDETISRIEKELEKLESYIPENQEKPQTPLEEIRTKVVFEEPIPNIAQTVVVKANRKQFQIDFDNNTIQSASNITPKDITKLNEFFENANAYTFKQLNINEKNVFLIKHNKLGKFVIFDENYVPMKENKELLKNKEYKNFKNCE